MIGSGSSGSGIRTTVTRPGHRLFGYWRSSVITVCSAELRVLCSELCGVERPLSAVVDGPTHIPVDLRGEFQSLLFLSEDTIVQRAGASGCLFPNTEKKGRDRSERQREPE